MPARLDDDDVLRARHGAGGADELLDVADRFHVQHDAARGRVVAEVVDEVGEIDVEHGADRDKRGEADEFAQAPVEYGRTECTTLAQKRDMSRQRHRGGKSGVQVARRAHYAKAVWPDHSHTRALGLRTQFLLKLLTGCSRFSKARGNDQRSRDLFGGTLFDNSRNGPRRRDNYSQIGRFRKGRNVWICFPTHNPVSGRVDGVNLARERGGEQVTHHNVTNFARRISSAYYGD